MDVEASWKRIEWRVERTAWAIMLVALALGLAGFFGGGPLSSATTDGSSGGLAVSLEYERFSRARSVLELTLHVTVPPGAGEVSVGLPHDWLGDVDLETVTPGGDPRMAGGRTWFDVPAGADGGSSVITVQYRPRSWGSLDADIAIEAGERALTLHVDQMLAP